MIVVPYLNPPIVQRLLFHLEGENDALWILNQGFNIGCLNQNV
jgi:hypothetical protein